MKYYRKSNLGFLKYTVIVIMFIFILIISHAFSFIWNGTVLFFCFICNFGMCGIGTGAEKQKRNEGN